MVMCYNLGIMIKIEDLIRQAQEAQKRWRKPIHEDVKRPQGRNWREILENRTVGNSVGYKD